MKIAVYRRTEEEPIFMGFLKGKDTIVDNAGGCVGAVGPDDFFLDADAVVRMPETQSQTQEKDLRELLRRIRNIESDSPRRYC